MAYSRSNTLERMKVRAGCTSIEKEDTYNDLIQTCEDFVTIQTNIDVAGFPDAIGSIILQMALDMNNQIKSEGYQNETVEGITIRYQDVLTKYIAPLRRFRKLRTI